MVIKKIIFLIIILSALFCSFNNSFAQQNRSHLYFCEQYIDGEEINVANTFTFGWLTVMLDMRPANETFNTSVSCFITVLILYLRNYQNPAL